jgi:hypothetical protein
MAWQSYERDWSTLEGKEGRRPSGEEECIGLTVFGDPFLKLESTP